MTDRKSSPNGSSGCQWADLALDGGTGVLIAFAKAAPMRGRDGTIVMGW
ncbi:hypothetical protein [Roseiconus lacunae]|nr:hypothetical protein [Roseiconus lacunae]